LARKPARQPATARAAIDKATARWPLFADFHAAFGPVQRLRDDTWTESGSPFKNLNADAGASQAAGPSQKIRVPGKSSLKRSRFGYDGGSDVDLVEDAEGEDDPALSAPPTDSPDGSDTPTGSKNKQAEGVKRSRMSAWDERLSKAVANGRMEVAERAAALKQETALRVTQLGIDSRERMAERLAQQQERLAVQHRAIQNDIIERQMQGWLQVAQYRLDSERESRLSTEVLELTRMYLAEGNNPAEARRLAKLAVHGGDA
jgi:hypothetical protein